MGPWPRSRGAQDVRTDQVIVVGLREFWAGSTMGVVDQSFDTDAMIERFRQRAEAVRKRGLPPVEGPERQRFKEQAQLDFMDYAMIGDAETVLEGGILTLRVDLRPQPATAPETPAG
jgi:hypothetical protein